MRRTALAFMSYVNEDDHHENGELTRFRERLSGEVRMQTGEPFEIFQDRQDIKWGQQWQERIDQSLNAVTFLLPIITPAFFKSAACRAELERFLKREEELRRGDLILPVYYVNCALLNDKEKLQHDPLAQIIAARQYVDWRELRFEPFTTPQVGKTFAKLAEQIVAALERSHSGIVMKPVQPLSAPIAKTELGTVIESGTQHIHYGHHQYEKTEPPTVIVDAWHRGDYATITEALEAVKPGTRILVRPGLYQEGIVVDKPVELIGDGKRDDIVIEASGKHTVLFQSIAKAV